MTVSGARFYLYHLGPAAEAHVLVDQHQAGARGWLLLAFSDGDRHNPRAWGRLLSVTSVQQFRLPL